MSKSLPNAAEIRARLAEAGSESHAQNTAKLVPGARASYGTPLPVIRKMATELAKFGREDASALLNLSDQLWAAGSLDERQLVGKILERLGKWHPDDCLSAIESYLDSLDSWANADNLACFSMSPIVADDAKRVLKKCRRWIQDSNKWIRRFGVVVLRNFEKAKAPSEVFAILGRLRDDEDADVQKAVGWMLRSFSVHDADRVEALLIDWLEGTPSPACLRIAKQGLKKLSPEAQASIGTLL